MGQDYSTLRVPTEELAKARESKRDDETWGEFLMRCRDDPPSIERFVSVDEVEEVAEIRERLDRIETLLERLQPVEERVGGDR